MNRSILHILTSGLLVLLFVYTGTSKLLHFAHFAASIYNQPFPHVFARGVVMVIPPFELLLAVGLVINMTRKVALWGALVLLSLFALYSVLVLLHVFPYVPCSCGGILEDLGWSAHLGLMLIFIGVTVVGIRTLKKDPNQTITLSDDTDTNEFMHEEPGNAENLSTE